MNPSRRAPTLRDVRRAEQRVDRAGRAPGVGSPEWFCYDSRMLARSLLAVSLLLGISLASCHKKPDPKLLYASAEASGEIVVVDPEFASVLARIPVGKRPRGLKLSRDGRYLYVALSGSPRGGPNVDESSLPPPDRSADGIGVVDLSSRKLLRTLPSGQDPESFDLSNDGKLLFVSNEESAELTVLNLDSGTIVRKIPVGKEPEGVTVRPDGKAVYVTSEQDSKLSVIDTTSFAPLADIAVGKRPRAVAFSKDGSVGFVSNEFGGTLTVFDPHTNQVLSTIEIGNPAQLKERPMGLAFAPDGRQLFVSTGRGGSVAVVDVTRRAVDHRIENVGARPWGIAISADGKSLYTANGSSDDLSIVEVTSGRVVKKVAIGGLPWGVVTGASE